MCVAALAPLIASGQTTGAANASPSASANSAGQQAKRRADTIYGSQLMTADERAAYREKMRAAKTSAERERLRTEHHKEMQARAKERGVTLPDAPSGRSHRGRGMGPRGGMGPGRGAGAGPGAAPAGNQ
ncbi:hypothetical protein FAY22_15850 [Noviherbaspirillum sp. UKPF54]|nr:hypothetical protein FAY22_15850 [Noviherbaspirillum sp. UKPF54]